MNLYLKTLGWVVLNLVVLALMGLGILWFQRRMPLDSPIADPGGRRLQMLASSVAGNLLAAPRDRWSGALESASRTWNVQLALFRSDATPVAGTLREVPAELREPLSDPRIRAPDPSEPDSEGSMVLPPPPWGHFAGPPGVDGSLWAAVRLPIRDDGPAGEQLALVVRTDPVVPGAFLFDLRPLLVAAAVAVAVSALVWWPFVHRIVAALDRVTRVTERIADGYLGARVPAGPGGEVGRLGKAVNRMAERLEGNSTTQRRFLRDVAHELSSPVARMQMALELEQGAEVPTAAQLAEELGADVAVLRDRVEELLEFSRATDPARGPKTETILLEALLQEVAATELGGRRPCEMHVHPFLQAVADRHLLGRAVANILRNTFRHAGPEARIRVTTSEAEGMVELLFADNGPGVPAWALDRIGEPFFRVDPSRDRRTGGAGLGLSLVVAGIQACGGEVRFRNGHLGGFEVLLRLRKPGKPVEGRPAEAV